MSVGKKHTIIYDRLLSAEIHALTNVQEGETYFNTDTNSLVRYENGKWIQLQTKEIIVRELNDLPQPVGNIITLEANTHYLFSGIIDIGNNKLQLSDNTVLSGYDTPNCGIIYSGTESLFNGEDVSVFIANLKLVVENGSIFNLQNVSKTKYLVFTRSMVITNDIGTIEGFSDVNFEFNRYKDIKDGIVFIDNKYLTISRQYFDDNVTPYYDYTSDQNITVNPNEYVLLVEGSGIGTVGRVYENVSGASITINSSTDYLTNDWQEITHEIMKFDTNGGDFNEIRIENCRFKLPDGMIGINFNTNNINILDFGILLGNSFEGIRENKLVGINLFDGGWEFVGNTGVHNALEVTSMTTEKINSITNPKIGLCIYNVDEDKYAVYTSSGWQLLNSVEMLTTIFSEDWESGDFTTNGWVVVNDDTNKWIVGSADSYEGTYSAYISNNNSDSQYTNNVSQVSHIYIDINLPAGITKASLSFQFKGEGEVNYDYLRVYDAPNTYIPTAGSLPDNSYLIGKTQYNNQSVWAEQSIDIDVSNAGTTRRYIFSWRNDSSVGTNPGAMIDNVKLKVKQ